MKRVEIYFKMFFLSKDRFKFWKKFKFKIVFLTDKSEFILQYLFYKFLIRSITIYIFKANKIEAVSSFVYISDNYMKKSIEVWNLEYNIFKLANPRETLEWHVTL